MPTPGPPLVSPGGPRSTLPVEATIEHLRSALRQTSSAVLQAPPGAGKTTIVPLRLLAEPWLDDRRIVMLEPRRLAARAAARRMADLLGEEVGGTVGYRTRDERHVGRDTRIEVVTEGILTRRLQRDPSLTGTGLVIFDEIHERNLQSDLALAFALDARDALRPDLRILAMSATLDTDRVAGVIGRDEPAPVIRSVGRTHPVDIRWRAVEHHGGRPPRIAEAAAAAVQQALEHDTGDVLVFLAGAADIRRVESLLGGHDRPADVDVRPLYGALSLQEQDLALAPAPAGRRRVVLATDIAETSLTVEGIRVVIDSGQVRSPHYDSRSGLTRLRTGVNSRASADQRAGRAGRVEPGVAYRLWSKMEHATRRPFADPEIVSVDLTGFALELAVWGTSADDLTFLDPPPRRSLDVARRLLHDLGALDADGRVTDAGRSMSELPVHPRLARMVTAGADLGLGSTACSLAALLEERDVLRGRPDELPANIVDRLRLVDGTATDHPRLDRSALHLVRRRAGELTRRAGIARSGRGSTDPMTAAGLALALAYPDRVAQARGNGRFRMRNGAGAWLPEDDALTGEPFLVVAELAADARAERGRADHRILLAAALDESDVELAAGDGVERITTLAWDPERDDLRLRTERRLGSLVLASGVGPAEPGAATVAASARPRPGHPPRGARLVANVAGAPDPPPVRTSRLRRRLARRLRRRPPRFPRRVVGATTPRHDASRSARAHRHGPPAARPRRSPPRPPARRRRAHDVHARQRTARPHRLRRRAAGHRRTGAGPLRHHDAPVGGRREDPPRAPPALARGSSGADHRGSSRFLGRQLVGGAQGHGRSLPQARLAARPRVGDPVPVVEVAIASERSLLSVVELVQTCPYRWWITRASPSAGRAPSRE